MSDADKYRLAQVICLVAGFLFSWLAGFCTAGLLFARQGSADSPSPREQQIERYEGMGR